MQHFLSEERTCAKKETLFPSEKAFTENAIAVLFVKLFFVRKGL